MSAVKGVNFTLDEGGTSKALLDRGTFRGKLRVYEDSYEASGLANPSTIQIGPLKLQKNVKIVAIILSFDALGGSTTLSVGDAASATRYINAVATNAAGSKRSDLVDGMFYKVTGTNDDIILITLGGGVATGTIKIAIITSEE